jgi:hypothetical protein
LEEVDGWIYIRVFAENYMISNLSDKNYSHFFIDGTFDCVPSGGRFLQFIVCLAYNETKDYFSPMFYALMSNKSEKAYRVLHQQIKLLNQKFKPAFWTLDFEIAHINVNNTIY